MPYNVELYYLFVDYYYYYYWQVALPNLAFHFLLCKMGVLPYREGCGEIIWDNRCEVCHMMPAI